MKLLQGTARTAALFCFLLTIGGCTSLESDICANQANLPKETVEANGCAGDSFLSASNLRGTTYEGDDSARLWTGASTRTEPNINPSAINAPPASRAPVVGFMGTLRVEVPADQGVIAKDLSDVQLAGAPKFDPNETVTVNFSEASLQFFLQQLLGGALGVNYIAPPNLGGSITFRTEQPIPKSQVIQVVRDVLARNGLQMAFMNGVYQVATPDVITAMQAASASSRNADQATRVVRLQKGKAEDIIAFVRQLVPEEVTLSPANQGSAVIIRAAPTEIDKIGDLIAVADSGVGDDRVAIIPLRESAPDKMAIQLKEFYQSQLGQDGGVTVMPLENQQAILVGTKDGRVMEGLKRLVIQLDRDTGSDFSLRVIPLTYLGAEEIVPQLSAIFTGNDKQPVATTAEQGNGASSISSALSPLDGAAFQNAQAPSDGGSSSQGGDSGSQGASQQGDFAGSGSSPGGAGGAPINSGTQQSIRIVADERSNAVMIYSSYSLFKRVRDLLKMLDVQQAQVVIEATIAEVTLNDQLQRGVEAFLSSNNIVQASPQLAAIPTPSLEISSNPGGGVVSGRFGVGGATVDVILTALQSVTKVKVVSSPYLTVRDGKTARLVIGNQIPFTTSTISNNPGTGDATVTAQIEVKDTGVILEVTPRIRADNTAILAIKQSVSAVSEEVDTGELTPTINTREVNSEVIAQSGATILLAGLMEERVNKTDNGIPVLQDLALVGDLFKTKRDEARRQELIVMITPRVIRNSQQIENITRQLRGLMHIR